jgi:hypothetical protein
MGVKRLQKTGAESLMKMRLAGSMFSALDRERQSELQRVRPDLTNRPWRIDRDHTLYVDCPVKCPKCSEWVPWPAMLLVNTSYKTVVGSWDSRTGDPIVVAGYHPHVNSARQMCTGHTGDVEVALFSGIDSGIHYGNPQKFFYDLGHRDCGLVAKHKCAEVDCENRVALYEPSYANWKVCPAHLEGAQERARQRAEAQRMEMEKKKAEGYLCPECYMATDPEANYNRGQIGVRCDVCQHYRDNHCPECEERNERCRCDDDDDDGDE